MKRIFYSLLIMGIIISQVNGQMRGSSTARRSGKHDGNRVYCDFTNGGYTTWNGWKHYGNGYVIDIQPLVAMQLPIGNYRVNGVEDDEPDTLTNTISCATHSNMDMNPSGSKFWGFEPVPGYYNPNTEGRDIGVAMSHLPQTWPTTWPDQPGWVDDNGQAEWNGYFGRGEMNADQESYFYMDDQQDEKMFAFHGFLPDSNDATRKGAGIKVKVRGLQWANPQAQDIMFWLYEVTNEGTTDYDKVSFGALVGTYVGGAGDEWIDDASFFDIRKSIVYSWDFDDNVSLTANPNWVGDPDDVGYIGYAFLESPGNPYDGIDNDGDNSTSPGNIAPYFSESDFRPREIEAGDQVVLIDNITKKRTLYTIPNVDSLEVTSLNTKVMLYPGETVLEEGNMILGNAGPELNSNAYDGYDNDLDGLIDENYQLHYRQYSETTEGKVLLDTINPVQYVDYFSGLGLTDLLLDESRSDGIDNDGDWDVTQDDLGADGKPETGDYGEDDGMPTPGEPHFEQTDVNESDQIGLTNFDYFVPSSDVHVNDEKEMWERMTPGRFDVPESVTDNKPIRGEDGDFIFGSGYFPLGAGETQRFSLALVYGSNYKSTVRTRQIAQLIYDSNYNFPKAPDKPTLKAVPMDGKVMLYWDRVAESSYDKVLGEYDFEGYKIYRSTDYNFSDCEPITNGYGEVVASYPYHQMDKKNDIQGFFHPDEVLYETISAMPYFLGEETGIQNTFIDENVENGRTYYYAICAYDHGSMVKSIYPSENTKSITMDITGKLTFDKNTVQVTPNAPVSNYEAPESGVMLIRTSGISSGIPIAEVVDAGGIVEKTYIVSFTDSLFRNEVPVAWAYTILDSATGDTVMVENDYWGATNGDVFDGMRLSFDTRYQNLNNVVVDTSNKFWNNPELEEIEPLATEFEFQNITSIRCPYDYMIVFHDEYDYPSSKLTQVFGNSAPLRVKNTNMEIFDITDSTDWKPIEFGLLDYPTYPGTISNFATIFLTTPDGSQLSWRLVIKDDNTENDYSPPGTGDTLRIIMKKPFTSEDNFVYHSKKSTINNESLKEKMEKIRVVPNPYIVANAFETPLPFGLRGRGERIIYFNHLPANSKISIFDVSGTLIRRIKHDGDLEDGSVVWDLKSREGIDVAYGIYFYVVECDGKSKTGKIAIIK